MRHEPHLYLGEPWDGERLGVTAGTQQHLAKVLRYPEGGPVSYTDGVGRIGTGTWLGRAVERGRERTVEQPSTALDIAVAPPRSKDRQRSIVEKCQELGVRRLIWLDTVWGNKKIPSMHKVRTWSVGALEQSRGGWLLETDGFVTLSTLGTVFVADRQGRPLSEFEVDGDVCIAVGPEAGFAPDEIPDGLERVRLSAFTLRTDTAAIVAAGVLGARRLGW